MGTLLAILMGITVASKIDTVIIYPNQVIVIRTATVNINGTEELVFPELPGALDDNSVRLRAPGLKIGEVQVKRGYLAEPTPEVKRLEQKVQRLQDSVQLLEDEKNVLRAKEEFLNSVKLGTPEIIARELQQGRVAPESWRGALNFLAEELTRVKARQLTLTREQEAVKKRLDAAKRELQDARALMENRKEVRLVAEGTGANYPLTLTYALPRAAEWRPDYELRAKPGNQEVTVHYAALITQRTGEDWENTKVILSTSTPITGLQPPQPYPWYLGLADEPPRKMSLMAPGAPIMAREEDAAQGYPEAEADVTTVETGISLQFVIPGRVNLKSGATAKKLPLHQATLPAKFDYYTLPRTSENSFLTASLQNNTDLIFLPGNARTYVGDEFTGTTALPSLAPQESIAIGFGVDERVKVKRELVKTFKSRTGPFGRTERVQFVYRTTVTNYHPRPIKIKIVEQVPVSQQKEIRVTVTSITPGFSEHNENEGTYTYYPELKPNERFEVNLEFQVEYPAGKIVTGLY